MTTTPPIDRNRYRFFRSVALISSVATLVEHVDDPDHTLTILLWSVIVAAAASMALRDLREWWEQPSGGPRG